MINLQKEKQTALTAEQHARQSERVEKEARAAADKARLEADEARLTAENAEQRSMQIRKSTAPKLVEYAQKEYSLKKYFHAKKLVEEALISDPEHDFARLLHVRYLFGFHKFSKALKEMDKLQNPAAVQWLKELCLQCLKYPADQLIKSELMFTVMAKLQQHKMIGGLKRHFLISTTMRYKEADRLAFARQVLKRMCVKKIFRFDLLEAADKTYTLSLAGNKGIHDITVLNNLPISELDLSDTDVDDLSPLSKMPLRKLDISSTHVNNIDDLATLPLKNFKPVED